MGASVCGSRAAAGGGSYHPADHGALQGRRALPSGRGSALRGGARRMNTFWIFRTELRRLFRSRIGRAALIVGLIIPLLYSSLYLYAFWDPYKQMDQFPVALVYQD